MLFFVVLRISIVDGDKYEEKNLNRQTVFTFENKAISCVKYYREMFTEINLSFFDKYVNKDNISSLVSDEDVVLVCVDNNKTRMIVEEHIKTLDNVTVINGGNELYDGNVLIMQKVKGELLTPLFSDVHPEIADGKDKSPEEMSCEELSKSEPQISIVNASIAEVIRRTLFAMTRKGIDFYEVFVNCETGNTRNVKIKDLKNKLTIVV